MAFVNDLQMGRRGLSFDIPKTFTIAIDGPNGISLQDPDHQVMWDASVEPHMLDLRREYDDLLQSDIRRSARAEFLDYQNANHKDNPNPRADNPKWSSIIEFDYAEVDSAPALYVLRRLAYHHGDELVIGHVMIPVADGTFDFRAGCRINQTGMRESILMLKLTSEHKAAGQELSPEDLIQRATPEYMDDPKHDPDFPDHPLTLVRAACRWLMDSQRSGLRVIAPMAKIRTSEKALPHLNCAITPPPRYVYAPISSQRMGLTMAIFTRTAIASTHDSRFLGVWRVPNLRIEGSNRQDQLAQFAERTLQAWRQEGASDIHVETTRLPDEAGMAIVITFFTLKVRDSPKHGLSRWFADTDGAVFRLELGAPPYVSKEEMEADLDSAFKTWRRLDEVDSVFQLP